MIYGCHKRTYFQCEEFLVEILELFKPKKVWISSKELKPRVIYGVISEISSKVEFIGVMCVYVVRMCASKRNGETFTNIALSKFIVIVSINTMSLRKCFSIHTVRCNRMLLINYFHILKKLSISLHCCVTHKNAHNSEQIECNNLGIETTLKSPCTQMEQHQWQNAKWSSMEP